MTATVRAVEAAWLWATSPPWGPYITAAAVVVGAVFVGLLVATAGREAGR
jgi:hypothetical protein